jgi:hypothetical protein
MQTRDAFSAVVKHKANNMMESFFTSGEYYQHLTKLAGRLGIKGEALCVLGAIDAMIFDMAQAGGFTGGRDPYRLEWDFSSYEFRKQIIEQLWKS